MECGLKKYVNRQAALAAFCVFMTCEVLYSLSLLPISQFMITRMENPEVLEPCNRTYTAWWLNDESRHYLQTLDLNSLKMVFHSIAVNITYNCTSRRRFGNVKDGGYDICMSPPFLPRPHNCLVYSFGIDRDWSFDEGLAEYGCEVHSFDPSIGLEDHVHSTNVYFHNIGLWGTDITNNAGWHMNRLSTIKKKLNHTNRVIDVMKVDVEGAEWPLFRELTSDPQLSNSIKQLLVEIHAPRYKDQVMNREDFFEIIHYKKVLHKSGYRLFQFHKNNFCCGRFAPMMPVGVRETCCYETFYVNDKYLGVK